MTKTAQQIFDTAYEAIIKQGKPAAVFNGSCYYRGPGGTKCAFGHLIPDSLYDPTFERRTASALLKEDSAFLSEGVPEGIQAKIRALQELYGEHKYLISDIQRCHDQAAIGGADFIDLFKSYMNDVATKYNLVVKEQEEA